MGDVHEGPGISGRWVWRPEEPGPRSGVGDLGLIPEPRIPAVRHARPLPTQDRGTAVTGATRTPTGPAPSTIRAQNRPDSLCPAARSVGNTARRWTGREPTRDVRTSAGACPARQIAAQSKCVCPLPPGSILATARDFVAQGSQADASATAEQFWSERWSQLPSTS